LIIATTRPETMFVDTNVVINPNDERFKKYIGKNFINPINGEKLKMITDDSIEMDFGTGVMKLTPAHDFNDFSIAKKNNITKYDCCIELDGKLNSFANNKYFNLEGTDRIIARKTIIEVLNKMNLIEKIDENYENNIGYSERSGEIVEPLFSLQ
jgi:valyl-tRNA synthetase